MANVGVRNFFLEAFSMFRKQKRAEAARTMHYYALRAPSIELPPTEELIRELEQRGYQIELEDDDEGWTVRDKRVARDYGQVLIKPPEQLEHCMLMLIETSDNGPEFYDELASYAIAALGRGISLTVRETGKPDTTASAIERKLPDSPLGLIGVENLR